MTIKATFLAAIDAALRHPSAKSARKVYLTLLGGGVFGNALTWILSAIQRACERYRHFDLQVVVVSYSTGVDPRIKELVRTWNIKRQRKALYSAKPKAKSVATDDF